MKIQFVWFGGGFDLTPFYPFEEDAQYWHNTAKRFCAPFGSDVYQAHKACLTNTSIYLIAMKPWRWWFFFDDLNQWEFDKCFDYIKAVGEGYTEAYLPIVERRKKTEFGEREREFQLYRLWSLCRI